MTTVIKIKRGTTTPTTSNIVSGEIAVDTTAQKLYINDASTIKTIGLGNPSVSDISDLTATAAELNLLDGVTGTLVTEAGTQTLTNKTLTSPTFNTPTITTPTITGNATFDTNTLFVDATNNRIGIGTTSPAYQVEIENTGANALLVLDRTDGAACFIEGQATRSAFGSVGATPLALAYNSLAVVTIGASGAITVNPDGGSPFTLPTADGTANQFLQTNGSGTVSFASATVSDISDLTATATELNYTDGVTSNIQTQLNAKLPLSGGTMTGIIAGFESTGIDDNATSTALTIDSSGNVGIGTTSPSARLDVVSANNNRGFEVTVNDTIADQSLYANFIDVNLSGSDTVTADRTHVGLYLDIDSSATGGDTTNEHRIYGIYNDVDVTGDSNYVYGLLNAVRTTHSSGTISDMRGVYNLAEADGTGTVTSMFASYNYAISGTVVSGLVNAYGTLSKYLKESADTSTTSNAYGLWSEVEIDAGTITNAYGVRSIIDVDGGSIGNGYLFHGSFEGSSGTRWGVYINGEEKNYFSGNVGIGDSTPSYTLDVAGDINYTGTLYKNGVASGPVQVLIKNSSGTTIHVKVGLDAGGTTTNIKNSAGTTLNTVVGPFTNSTNLISDTDSTNPVGKQTIFIPATAMTPTASNGCSSLATVETTAGRPDMNVLDFGSSSDTHAQFQVAFPKSWNEGAVSFKAYWTVSAAVTTGVAWGLQGVAVSDNDTIDVAYGNPVVVTDDALNTTEDLCVTDESSPVIIAGTPAAEDMVFFRVFRDVSDANDDMTQDARLIGIKLFFTTEVGNDE